MQKFFYNTIFLVFSKRVIKLKLVYNLKHLYKYQLYESMLFIANFNVSGNTSDLNDKLHKYTN